MIDFSNQAMSALRGGFQMGQQMRAMDLREQQQQFAQEQAAERQRQQQLTMQMAMDNQARQQQEAQRTQYLNYAAAIASLPHDQQDAAIVELQQAYGQSDPVLNRALTDLYQLQGRERDTALFGFLDVLGTDIQRRDKPAEELFGIQGITFQDLPADMKTTYLYNFMTPEQRDLAREAVNMRDQTPEQAAALTEATEMARISAGNFDDQQQRLRGYVAQGEAARGLVNRLERAIDIQGDIETGGTANARRKLQNFFGIETSENADMSELNSLLGSIVLGQIRMLGANPTEGEREFLLETIGSLEQSRIANLAILERSLQEARNQFNRGRESYLEIVGITPDYKSAVMDSVFGFGPRVQSAQPQQGTTVQPGTANPAPVPQVQPTQPTYNSMEDIFNRYGGN